jgi:glycine/D-amino acid oxidase-like deaminating enzyme
MPEHGHQEPWRDAPLWAGSLPPSRTSARVPDRPVDVVVIGGGLTGLLSAVVLQRAGLDVVVLERHDGVGGVTSRGSTGKLTALQGDKLVSISEHHDPGAVADYVAAARLGVAGLRELVTELGLDCGFTETADHTFATDTDAVPVATTVLDVAREAGLPVEWVAETELPVPVIGAVRLADQAHLDPGALCAGLAEVLGDRVVTRCAVQDVTEEPGEVIVTVEGGTTVRAGHAVVATLGPVHDPALLATRCSALRSYVVAAPLERPFADTHISVDLAPRSVRPATIDGRPAVVVAGAGHVVGELEGRSPQQRWSELEAYALTLGAGAATHRWVAHDLVPSDHVPFIGRISPSSRRVYVATGFGKWGISTAMAAADLFLGDIEGRPRPWAGTFDPTRIAATLTVDFVKDGLRAVRHLVWDRVADVLHGGHRRPRCTHLGCELAFDDAQGTWDCPCHGSRYDAGGRVVCGPAVTDLDAADIRRAQVRDAS